MPSLHQTGTFLSAAETVGAATTLSSTLVGGSDFTSKQIDVTACERIGITVQATGANAGMTGIVAVDLVVACQSATPLFDTANHIDQIFATVELQLTTNAAERVSNIIDVEGFATVGVGRLRNSDVAFAADVQVYYGKYERF